MYGIVNSHYDVIASIFLWVHLIVQNQCAIIVSSGSVSCFDLINQGIELNSHYQITMTSHWPSPLIWPNRKSLSSWWCHCHTFCYGITVSDFCGVTDTNTIWYPQRLISMCHCKLLCQQRCCADAKTAVPFEMCSFPHFKCHLRSQYFPTQS